jgi:SAM-dependent methyltransferase
LQDYTEGDGRPLALPLWEQDCDLDAELTITLERGGIWRGAPPRRRRSQETGEPGKFNRPVRGRLAGGEFLAWAWSLPVPDEALESVDYSEVLEYIQNDDLALEEIARVIAIGGKLRLRVPARGPLAGLDAYNLMHYLVDTTHRGDRPYETSEIGWRRHYSVDDLMHMLGRERFRIRSVRRRGLALAQLFDVAALALFRWQRPNHDRYRSAKRLVNTIARIENRIVTPFGFFLELDVVRLPDPVDVGDG